MIPTARIENPENQEANSLPPITALRDGCVVSSQESSRFSSDCLAARSPVAGSGLLIACGYFRTPPP
jgi:hypothetical protein